MAGIPGEPNTYYFGATGGGVWKTEDGGLNWKCVSDGFFRTGSVGAIAVSGGTAMVVGFDRPVTEDAVRNALASMPGDKTVQRFGPEGLNQVNPLFRNFERDGTGRMELERCYSQS